MPCKRALSSALVGISVATIRASKPAAAATRVADRGEHELKGIPDRWHLYQVVK